MLRITIHDSAGECRFRLEGKLAGASVNELEMCWRTASSTTAGRRTAVDLRRLEAADASGGALLQAMARDGVELIRGGEPRPDAGLAPAWLRHSFKLSIILTLLAFPPRF
jgi:hypothetical protein